MLKLTALAVAIGLTTGCSVVALHPLAGDQAAPVDAAIEGVWKPVKGSEAYRITKTGDTMLKYFQLDDQDNAT